jgi:LacI family transcriptional regulator
VGAPLDKLGGFHAAERLLDRHGVTAIFAASDQQAIGAMKAIAERGLVTGRDVAVVGFDGVAEGAFTVPGLTTMAQPIRKMGEEAVRALLSSVDTDSPASSQKYDVSMIIRGSCGCSHDMPRLGTEALALAPRPGD